MSEPTAADARPRVARHFRLQWEEAQDTWVLLYPEGMVKLNQSAAEIMQRCNGERSVNDIVTDLESTFAQRGLIDDVLAFLDLARKQRWVEV